MNEYCVKRVGRENWELILSADDFRAAAEAFVAQADGLFASDIIRVVENKVWKPKSEGFRAHEFGIVELKEGEDAECVDEPVTVADLDDSEQSHSRYALLRQLCDWFGILLVIGIVVQHLRGAITLFDFNENTAAFGLLFIGGLKVMAVLICKMFAGLVIDLSERYLAKN